MMMAMVAKTVLYKSMEQQDLGGEQLTQLFHYEKYEGNKMDHLTLMGDKS
jgi:hypothetical protein